MKCKYEIEYVYPNSLSFKQMKENICRKIANIIIFNENAIWTL